MKIKSYTSVRTGLSYNISLKDGSEVTLNNHVFKGIEDGNFVFLDLASRTDLSEDAANIDMSALTGVDFPAEAFAGAEAVTSDYTGEQFPMADVEEMEICPTSLDWLTIPEDAHMFQYASSVQRD